MEVFEDVIDKSYAMGVQKNIALVAHDNRKKDLIDWIRKNKDILSSHFLYGTGTTGSLIAQETGLPVRTYKSGPLGGDQQIGARIIENDINILVFFWDPLEAQPHDPDVKALLRIAVLYDVPVAMNVASLDFMFRSEYMKQSYDRMVIDYSKRLKRHINI